MTWDLATAKIYLDLVGDPSKDTVIMQVMAETLRSVELVLGRGLLEAQQVETFYNVATGSVLLHRFPVIEVLTINGAAVPTGYTDSELQIDLPTGRVSGRLIYGCLKLDIDYNGGYTVLPTDLERAMWSAFLTLWGATDQDTGAPVIGAGGATVVAGSGDVSKVTLADFGSVSFDVGATVAQDTSSATLSEADWGWLLPWAATFQFYRAGQAGAGLGIA